MMLDLGRDVKEMQETITNDGSKPLPSPPKPSKATIDAKAYAKGGATKERETRSGMRRRSISVGDITTKS